VLRSDQRELIYTTVAVQRPDVAVAYGEPRWRLSGFRCAIPRDRLPKENIQICLLHAEDHEAEYAMTRHWLRLADPTASPPWISNDS
jgi:hypothetical protein